jgi:GDP-L-fucose synthase
MSGLVTYDADSSKLHSLGWKHKVELEDGIKKIYAWYLNRL